MDEQQPRSVEAETDERQQQEAGSSKGEVLTLSLFGVMVIIASVCFVIW